MAFFNQVGNPFTSKEEILTLLNLNPGTTECSVANVYGLYYPSDKERKILIKVCFVNKGDLKDINEEGGNGDLERTINSFKIQLNSMTSSVSGFTAVFAKEEDFYYFYGIYVCKKQNDNLCFSLISEKLIRGNSEEECNKVFAEFASKIRQYKDKH